MTFRDVEAVLADYLRANLSVPVSTKVPSPRPTSFVRSWRTGGPTTSRVTEQPQMTVEAWAGSKGAAADLALDCRELLLDTARRATAGFHRVRIDSLYYDPDPDSGTDRYTLAVFLTVRAARA
jgi:hypothetical protein